jgi:hypothetical protein
VGNVRRKLKLVGFSFQRSENQNGMLRLLVFVENLGGAIEGETCQRELD